MKTFVDAPLQHAMRFAALLVALIVALPAAAHEVAVRTHREGEAILVSASALVPTDLASAWSVLTDYARYAQFVPDLHVSRIRGRDERGLIVEQSGDARFLFLRQPVEATLAVTEIPMHSVTSTAIGGSFRAFTGRYELVPVPGGTRLSYTGRLVPGDAAPVWLTAIALKANVERHFGALAAEIARHGEPARLARQPASTPAN
jgi:ribosome-associated toxin RatA of RatAB toxin-antitoxin module